MSALAQEPGRSPQGPSPLTTPLEPPHPVLKQAGLNMGVQGLNQKVQALTQAHQQSFGTQPTPGLVLDVLRSGVPEHQYQTLFSIPQNQAAAQAQKALQVHKQTNPDDFFTPIPGRGGLLQPSNPIQRMIQTTPPPPTVKPGTFQSLQAKYPMVQAGALPLPGELLGAISDTLSYLNGAGGPTPEMNAVLKANPGLSKQQVAFVEKTLAAQTPIGQQGTIAGPGGVRMSPEQARRQSANTLTEAKTELARESGIEFSPGPTFNQDDASKLSNWMHSESYFKTQLAFQAKQANQTVAEYTKSFDAKWGKGSPVHNGLVGHFLVAFPQQLWGHGGFWGDLLSIPNFIKGGTTGSNNPINVLLHGLTRTAGLTLDTVGGTVSQLKADTAAATTLISYMAGLHGSGVTYEQALDKAREQLRANPSWLRLVMGGYLNPDESQLPAWERRLDQGLNVAGDLLLLRKVQFTGEKTASGDLAAALKSDRINAGASWAFQDLKAFGPDGVERAASRLNADPRATGLVEAAAQLVKDGKMTQDEFVRHAAELYSQGETEIAGRTITGSIFPEIRTDKLPAPGTAGTAWLKGKSTVRSWLDNYNATANTAVENSAVSLVNHLRSEISHAAPTGAKIGTSQRILTEQVFNFVRKYKLADDQGANALTSELARAQGRGDVSGITAVNDKLHALWEEKFPSQKIPMTEQFRAQLSTENPSIFHFPGGADPKLDNAFDSITAFTKETNAFLNKTAKVMARIILSGLSPTGVVGGAAIGGLVGGPAGMAAGALLGGPLSLGGFSLMWKHVVGDGLRAYTAGVSSLLTSETKQALADIERLAKSDPAFERQLGALQDRIRTGESRWALGRNASNAETFQTGDILLPDETVKNVFRSHAKLDAAGGYLRRHLTAPELQGYRDGNLVDVILKDREARAAWQSQVKVLPDLTAEQHAEAVAKEYQDIEAALHANGLTFDDALNYMRANRGHEVDAALGRFIQKNKLDFNVRGGQVEPGHLFDDLTSRWVGNVIMRPNKMWRSSLGRAVLGKHYAELRNAGFSEENAFHVASDLAEQVVKFHMLDFANRLQVEQDFRWLSFFATKHRLYFKWVLSTFLRHPAYAAAVADFQQTLNSSGGWTLPFKVNGQNWQAPLERLVWVPGHEYDETSSLGQFAISALSNGLNLDQTYKQLVGGGNAPTITRSDIAVVYGTKLLKIDNGKPATYLYAASGLSAQNHDQVFRAINEYQQEYFSTHGHYATEPHAVKIVLAQLLGQEYWRANLPLPFTALTGQTDAQHKLINEYESLVDPAARRKFLDDHPGFSDHFGVYENPKVKIHNDTLYRRWNTALDVYRQGRAQLYADLRSHPNDPQNTTTVNAQRRALSARLERTRNQLLVDDAQQWGIDTHGQIPDGIVVPFGPWGKVVNKDPQFDPSHTLSALFPKLDKTQFGDVIGPLQKQAQNDLTQLNNPSSALAQVQTPDEARVLKRELIQKLELFKAYPTDALGVVQDTYQSKYVNPYWTQYNKRSAAAQATPSGDSQKAADAAFRAWRDSQDKPVVVDGITFPSPARMAWAMLPPQTRQERLSYLSSKPLVDLANYELDLLDVKHPKNVSAATDAIDTWKADYNKTHPDGPALRAADNIGLAKAVNKQYPGYYPFYVNVLSQPRVRQFQLTAIYQDMPADVRQGFNVIAQAALENIRLQKQSGNASHYKREWRSTIAPYFASQLNDPSNVALKKYLAPMGRNFISTLVSGG